jgi:hypothetical protein
VALGRLAVRLFHTIHTDVTIGVKSSFSRPGKVGFSCESDYLLYDRSDCSSSSGKKDVTSNFNRYHAWLDLPADVQRPSYYQLLHIPEFEQDVNKLKVAADRALARVRGFQPGERAADWSKLLDELAKARSCLADPAKKQAYDQALKKYRAQRASGKSDPPKNGKPNVADVNSNPDLFPPGMAPQAGRADAQASASAGQTREVARQVPKSRPAAKASGASAVPARQTARRPARKGAAAQATETRQPATRPASGSPSGRAPRTAPGGHASAETAPGKAAVRPVTTHQTSESERAGEPRRGLVNAHVAPPPEPKRSAVPLVIGVATVLTLLTFGVLYLAMSAVW